MKNYCFAVVVMATSSICTAQKAHTLFNGRNFDGWQGDTVHTWHIQDGMLVGGTPHAKGEHNEFLATTRSYKNFELRLKFRLTGDEGFVNAGVQFHSKRVDNPPYEMSGYQADLGDGYWASLYDESRRNKTLVHPDSILVENLLKRQQWNDYEVRAENGKITIRLNGKQTVSYREEDRSIPQSGLIALQVHGGGNTVVYYKDIYITELR